MKPAILPGSMKFVAVCTDSPSTQRAQRGEAATDRSAPVPGRSNVGSLAVWEQSRASSQASLAAAGTAGTAALREISSQLANDFAHCSAKGGVQKAIPNCQQPGSPLRITFPCTGDAGHYDAGHVRELPAAARSHDPPSGKTEGAGSPICLCSFTSLGAAGLAAFAPSRYYAG